MTERPSDRDLLLSLARHLRKHDVLCFDPDDDYEQARAQELVEWFADSVDVLNVPATVLLIGDLIPEPTLGTRVSWVPADLLDPPAAGS